MAEEFQALLDRINKEYLLQAETEKETILNQAKAEAESIVAAAKAEADRLRTQAENDAEAARTRAEAAARQAARDIVLGLREELTKRLDRIVRETAGEALTPELMAAVVRNMAAANGADEVKVLAGIRDAEQMRQLLCSTLRESFRQVPEVFPNRNIHAGMQVAFQGEDLYVDLTDEAVCELLRAHLGGELGRMLEAK